MKRRTLIILLVVNVIYIHIGAFLFSAIESRDNADESLVTDMIREFVDNRDSIPSAEVESFARYLVRLMEHELLRTNGTVSNQNWRYASALLFAATAVTTIGYGHVTPVTTLGRATCIVYIIVGIPLMATLLGGIGRNLNDIIRPKLEKHIWIKRSMKTDVFLKMATVDTIIIVLLVYIPAAVFSTAEGWSYSEAVYFAFTTLTTVGFGDYYIAHHEVDWINITYHVFVTLWVLLGLAGVATMITEAINRLSGQIDQPIEQTQNTAAPSTETSHASTETDKDVTHNISFGKNIYSRDI